MPEYLAALPEIFKGFHTLIVIRRTAVTEKDNIIIGKRIKKLHVNAKLSKSQLAEKAEINTNNLNRISSFPRCIRSTAPADNS